MVEVLAVMVGFIAIMFVSINVLQLPIQLALLPLGFSYGAGSKAQDVLREYAEGTN